MGPTGMRVMGTLEILAAIGLLLPGVTHIQPWLTPLAAALRAVVMLLAVAFHVRRGGEGANIANNLLLGMVATLVAIGRLFIALIWPPAVES